MVDTAVGRGNSQLTYCCVPGLELAALKEMVALGITGLHFPLMCTVDFLGQRLSVFSHLPIDASTIAYGRCVCLWRSVAVYGCVWLCVAVCGAVAV